MAEMGVLVTGFPGFIAGRLIERLISKYGDGARFVFLVEARFAIAAAERCRAIEAAQPGFAGRWELVEGDIRRKDCGIDEKSLKRIRKSVRIVWHLAAIYDLAVAQSLAYAVNVEGTTHVLDLCGSLAKLDRLIYVSTCYVAGNRTGRVYEEELDVGQEFKNHYESTKHWAERQVQARIDVIPTVIFRPAIVVGDSRTGETVKGDGPYFVMQLFLRLPGALPALHFGPSTAKVNLVPVDWLVDAMVEIEGRKEAIGGVFQLADPEPLTARQIVEKLAILTGHGKPVAVLPRDLVVRLLKSRRVQNLLGIPGESYPYFDLDVEFDTAHTERLLAGTGIVCPRFGDYAPRLVEYAHAHPEVFVKVRK